MGRGLGFVTLLLTLFGWVASPLFIKHFASTIDAWTSNGWRYGIGALFWLPVLLLAMRNKKLPKGAFTGALIPSVFNAAGQAAFAYAHYLIDPGLLTFGLRMQIVFVTIGAAILFPVERAVVRSPRFIAGIVLVLLGTGGTIVLDRGFGQNATLAGVALAIGSGVLFTGYALGVRRFMGQGSPIHSFALISSYTAALLAIGMVAFGHDAGADVLALPGDQFGLLVLSALLGIALGHVFYYISIQRLGVAVTAGVIQIQPVFVAAISSVLFPEQAMRTEQWLFGGVAIAGAVVILVAQQTVHKAQVTSDTPR